MAPATPMTTRVRRTERSLLEATEALLAEGTPFADLSVLSIARRAGVTRTTFYAYFDDKSALALRLGDTIETAVGDAVADWLRESRGDLRATLASTLEVFFEHRATIGALIDAAAHDPAVAAFWRSLNERFAQAARVRLGADQPHLPPMTVEARAFVLVWSTERCMTEHVLAPQVDRTALLDALVLLWSAALGRPVPTPD